MKYDQSKLSGAVCGCCLSQVAHHCFCVSHLNHIGLSLTSIHPSPHTQTNTHRHAQQQDQHYRDGQGYMSGFRFRTFVSSLQYHLVDIG